MKSIIEVLNEIGEDKTQNLSTTSFKFKSDVWEFFQGFDDKVAVEFGTHKGQTSRVLSYLFSKVHTVNYQDNAEAMRLNSDRTNINYISNFNLYTNEVLPIDDMVSMFFVDGGHKYEELVYDINRITRMNCDTECYLLFDDYGSTINPGIKEAVTLAVNSNVLEIVKFIGHESGYNFGNAIKGGPDRILVDYEGVITKIIWH
jgi:hypothetical protein